MVGDSHQTGQEEQDRLEAENARLREEILSLRQFIDSMQNLVEAAERPLGDTEILELLSDVLDNALDTINARDGSLMALDEDTGELVFVITRGDAAGPRLEWRRLPAGEGIAGWVAARGEPTIVNDARSDDRFYPGVDVALGFETRSVLAAPIRGGGKVLGVVEVINKRNGSLFSHHDLTLLSLMCRFSGELLHSLIRQSLEQS